jgi:hypothetical protein
MAGLWLGLKSPIKIPAPLSKIDKAKLSYFMNDELMELSQNTVKQQARLIRHDEYQKGYQSIWGGWLSNNRYVLYLINGMSSTASLTVSLTREARLSNFDSYSLRDPIAHRMLGSSSSEMLSVEGLAPHSLAIRILHF